MFEPGRIGETVPLEESMSTLKEWVNNGWIGGVALSEASAVTIRMANAIVPIKAVEYELSLWEMEVLNNDVAKTCAELRIPIHA